MSNNSSAKYYRDNKKRLLKELLKDIKGQRGKRGRKGKEKEEKET